MARDYLDEALGPPLFVTEDGVQEPRRSRIRVVGILVEDDPVTGEKVLTVTGAGGTEEILLLKATEQINLQIAGSTKFRVTDTLVEALTGATRVSGAATAPTLDTKTPISVAVATDTPATIFSVETQEDSSVLIAIAGMLLNAAVDGNNTTQEFKGRYDNIADTVTERISDGAGNFNGDTQYLTADIDGTTVNIIYDGPGGNFYAIAHVIATPPGSWT